MPDFARPKTSNRKLYAFQKAEAIYDLTYFFLERNISRKDRTHDQMLQAARSGKQNIAEGRKDSDYYMAIAPRLNDEELCNLIKTLILQTSVMLQKLIDLVKEDFLKNGGIKEQMYRARIDYRNNARQS